MREKLKHVRKRERHCRAEPRIVDEVLEGGRWKAVPEKRAKEISVESPSTVRFRLNFYDVDGHRRREFFKNRIEAKGRMQQLKTRFMNEEGRVAKVRRAELEEFFEVRSLLERHGVPLRDVVRTFLNDRDQPGCLCTVSELAEEFIRERTAKGMTALYLRDLRGRLGKFSSVFGSTRVKGVTVREVDEWAMDLRVGPQTVGNYLRVVSAMFGFAVRRGYCDKNPAAAVVKPRTVEGAVEIFTPGQIRALLECAEPAVVPFLAVGFFAGLRPAELVKLEWSRVDLERRLIEVTGLHAKTRRRRLVDISPNLFRWLAPHARACGRVTAANFRKMRVRAMTKAGVTEWPPDVMRHSFCSYHLAKTEDVAKTAMQAGNSPQVLFRNYRELVRRETAEEFWGIIPGDPERK